MAEAERDADTALKEYTAALDNDPSSTDIRIARARVYMQQDHLDVMKNELDIILKADPENTDANELLGTYYYNLKDQDHANLTKAREAIEKAAAQPSNPRVFYFLAQIYLEEDPNNTENIKKALAAFQKYADAVPGNPEGYYRMGLLNQALQDDAAAEADYVRAVEIAPTFTPAYRSLMGLYAHLNRTDDLRKLYKKILADNPLDLRTRSALAVSLYEQGLYSEAHEVMDYENLAEGYNPAAQVLAAKIFARLNRPYKVIEILKDSAPQEKAPIDSLLELAQAYERIGNFAESSKLFEKILTRSELAERAPILLHLGFAQQTQKRYAEAQKSYAEGIEAAKASADNEMERTLWRDRALLLAEMGEIKKAEDIANETYHLFPDDIEMKTLPADILWQAGRKKDAVSKLKSLLATQKNSWDIRIVLGRKLFDEKAFKEVVTTLKTADSDAKAPEDAVYLLGASYERLGDLRKSREILEKGIQRFPDSSDMMNYLGYTLIEHNIDMGYAVGLIQRAVTADPENEAFLDSLACGELKLGKLEDARKQIDLALKFGEPNWEILEHAGDIYAALGLTSEAVVFYEKALSSSPEEPARIKDKLAAVKRK